MTDPVFVDTNVLVYGRDPSEPAKQKQAAAWIQDLWATRLGRTSVQVLEEFYVTVTRKLSPGMEKVAARRDVKNLLAWRPVILGPELMEHSWEIQDRFHLSFWDALIVSAAQDAGCRYLITEDLGHKQRFDSLEVINPFVMSFTDLE